MDISDDSGVDDYQPILVLGIHYRSIGGKPVGNKYPSISCGLRPVVCLPSSVNAIKSGAIWYIE